jgi:hypothetical protein
VIDEQTVPEGLLPASRARLRMLASIINSPVPIISALREKPSEQKPIRRMFQGQVDNLGSGGWPKRWRNREGFLLPESLRLFT